MNQESFEQISYDAYMLYESLRYKEAFKKYKVLAEKGIPECQTFIGWMYAKGEGVEQDYDKAIEWCGKAAAADDPRALFYLAKVFILTGNKQHAFELMHKAASKGYAPAVFRLGYMYEEGYYVPADDDKAVALYRQADELGQLSGRKRLALCLMRGKGKQGLRGVFKGIYLFLTLLFSGVSALWADGDTDYPDQIRI